MMRRHSDGFTLVEMAVVLVIIGLLIMTVFPALTIARISNQRSVTQSNLNALMLATASYVQANGCLPCPTPANVTGAGFGRVRGDTAAAACNGCATAEGVVPYVSLGISQNVARDGWQHWITMRVDPALTTATIGAVVPPAAGCTAVDLSASPVVATCTLQGASQKGLCQSKLGTANRVAVQTAGGASQQAAVIFVSHGSKGYGAFLAGAQSAETGFNNGFRLPFPAGSPSCPANVANASNGATYAVCNANGKNQFINAPMQDNDDDILAYADRNTLVSMLGNGACQTVW